MQYPLWKKLLSYVKEISLEQTSSLSNPYLEVLLVKGRHQLVTKDAIYSFDDKYENFRVAFERTDLDKLPGHKILLLGLGLGSVIYILEKIEQKRFEYTAVEVDPVICQLCQKYTLSHIDSFVQVIPQEAMLFLEMNEEKYDLIIMDIFQSATIPQKFQSKAFLQMLASKLEPRGLMLYNRMNISSKDKQNSESFYPIMKEVFPLSTSILTKSNMILMSNENYLIK